MLEKNNICFTISLYSHETDDSKVFFSYFWDYLGFGLNIPDNISLTTQDINSEKFGQILSGKQDLSQPRYMSKSHYLELQQKLIHKMELLKFEDIFSIVGNM